MLERFTQNMLHLEILQPEISFVALHKHSIPDASVLLFCIIYHSIIGWFRLGRTLKITLFQPPALEPSMCPW